jgi:uncharacterized protein YgiM (DUF1202 family)
MPREPISDGPLVEAEVRADPGASPFCAACGAAIPPDDHFCGKCGAPKDMPEQGADAVHAQGGHVKMKQSKGKNANFSQGMSAARKKTIRSGPLMPLLFILALIWIGGMGYLAYRFFVVREGGPNGGVTVEYPGGDGGAQNQGTEQPEPLPPVEPLGTPETPAALSWSPPDARGYSDPVSPSGDPVPAISGTVQGDRVRLRSEPNTASRIIRHFNKGAKVEITRRYAAASEEYPWYQIKAGGRSGWMYGQYVGEITPRVE